MDKKKRGGKQKAVGSKGSKTKVDVHKHFNPVAKSRSLVVDEFPEVVLEDQQKRRKINSPSNYYDIEFIPNKRGVSLDRKDYKTPSASSSSSFSFSKNLLSTNDEKGVKRKTNVKRSPQRTKSRETGSSKSKERVSSSNTNNNVRNELKNQIKINEIKPKQKIRNLKLPSPRTSSPQQPSSPYHSLKDAFVIYKDPVVEKIKKEIGMSAKLCNEEVKQTVTELKAEIARYRKTLNKNVNFLQSKVKCNFSGDLKECSVQTEPSCQQRTKKLNQHKNTLEFQALVTKIAELISSDEKNSRSPQNVASASTETDRPISCSKRCQKTPTEQIHFNQSTETETILEKSNVATDNPINFINVENYQYSGDENLERQKENLNKLNELIDRTKYSLLLMKRNFQKRNLEISPVQNEEHEKDSVDVIHVAKRSCNEMDVETDSNVTNILMSDEKNVSIHSDSTGNNSSVTKEKLNFSIDHNVYAPEVRLIKHIITSFEGSVSSITSCFSDSDDPKLYIRPISTINTTSCTVSNVLTDSINSMVSQAVQKAVLEIINEYNKKLVVNGEGMPLKESDEKNLLIASGELKENEIIGDTDKSTGDRNLKRKLKRTSPSQDLIESFDNLKNIL